MISRTMSRFETSWSSTAWTFWTSSWSYGSATGSKFLKKSTGLWRSMASTVEYLEPKMRRHRQILTTRSAVS